MAKRKRDRQVFFRVTKEEMEQIFRRMEQAGIRSIGAYLRKMALNGYILHVDMSEIQRLVSLLAISASNLNQIAKRVNATGSIYQTDISDLQEKYAGLWRTAGCLLDKLAPD